MNKYVILVIIALAVSCYILFKENQRLQDSYSIAQSNMKAYVSFLDSSKADNRVLQLTVEELNYYKDSILQQMVKIKKELNIKDKNIKSLQYMLSKASRNDTIVFRDTIFRNDLKVDTILGDEWYQLKLGLRYPNIINVNPNFNSEKFVLINYSKETINPPKKCWLLRLFQKKHKVIRVEVIERNPYIINKQNRFIEIVK